jgi:HAD superfamily hydrolase (TIGR01509 family)
MLDFRIDRPTPERNYGAFIFDCDGTLAHSMPLHMQAWNAGLEAARAPFRLSKDQFMGVAGMALDQTIDFWNETHSLKIDHKTVIEAKNRYFEEARHTVQPIPPVVAYARELYAMDMPIAVASGGHREDVEETLKIIGVRDLFEVVTTADDVKRSKPDPEVFLLAAKRMGVPPEACCVLEDSELGIQAAEAAGMGWIRIPALLD